MTRDITAYFYQENKSEKAKQMTTFNITAVYDKLLTFKKRSNW